jgi:hypothetical protein
MQFHSLPVIYVFLSQTGNPTSYYLSVFKIPHYKTQLILVTSTVKATKLPSKDSKISDFAMKKWVHVCKTFHM